jgi:hypothetical protein
VRPERNRFADRLSSFSRAHATAGAVPPALELVHVPNECPVFVVDLHVRLDNGSVEEEGAAYDQDHDESPRKQRRPLNRPVHESHQITDISLGATLSRALHTGRRSAVARRRDEVADPIPRARIGARGDRPYTVCWEVGPRSGPLALLQVVFLIIDALAAMDRSPPL